MSRGWYQFVTSAMGVLLAWPNPASAEERLVEEREVAGWTLMVTANESKGETSCMVTRDDELGPILGVTVQSGVDEVFLVLANLTPGEMEQGAFYDVRYVIDEGAPVPVAAQARSRTMFLIGIGKTFAALAPLRRGYKIDFRAPETIGLFDLSGSGKAFDALQDCAERYIGPQFSGASGDSRLATPGNAANLQ